jgi:hypothetical protein
MKILCLRPYSIGYNGFMEDEICYTYFFFTKKSGLKRVMKFHKSDYESYGHFVGGVTKFFPYNYFLKKPVFIESFTLQELARISRVSNEGEV